MKIKVLGKTVNSTSDQWCNYWHTNKEGFLKVEVISNKEVYLVDKKNVIEIALDTKTSIKVNN